MLRSHAREMLPCERTHDPNDGSAVCIASWLDTSGAVDLVPFGQRFLAWGARDELYPPGPEIRFLEQHTGPYRVLSLDYLLAKKWFKDSSATST